MSGIACFALLTGCNKIKNLATIDVDLPYSKEFSTPTVAGYPAGTPLPAGGLTLSFPTVPMATNSKEYITKYNTSIDKINTVYLKKLALQVVTPTGDNFNYLDTIRLYLSTATIREVLVAYAYNVPKNQSELTLTTLTDVNLKNYYVEDTVYFRMDTHINAVPPTGQVLNLATVFHLQANPLN